MRKAKGQANELVFFDLIATGLKPEASEILELAAQRVDEEGRAMGKPFQCLVKPSRPVPLKVTGLTGITSEEASAGLPFKDAALAFLGYVKDTRLAGHNAMDFNRPMLQHHLDEAGLPLLENDWLDTMELAFFVDPLRSVFSLDSFCRQHLKKEETHRALQDCLDLAALFRVWRSALRSKPPAYLEPFGRQARVLGWGWAFLFPLEDLASVPEPAAPEISVPEKGEVREAKLEAKQIAAAFEAGGLLSKAKPGSFRERQGQKEMALEVARTINEQGLQAIEAGPGVGKTFAYLVPAMEYARKSGRTVILSTHTRVLQDQLQADIRALEAVWDGEITHTVLKGKANYLCLKLWQEDPSALPGLREGPVRFERFFLENWLAHTPCGNIRDEIPYFFQRRFSPGFLDRLTMDRECPGPACPHFRRCWAYRARQEAARCSLVITNHAILLQAFLSGLETLLPQKEACLIVDEAHHLESVATQCLTSSFSLKGLEEALAELLGSRRGPGLLARALRWLESQEGGEAELPLPRLQHLAGDLLEAGRALFSHPLRSWLGAGNRAGEGGSFGRTRLLDEGLRQDAQWIELTTPQARLRPALKEFLKVLGDATRLLREAGMASAGEEAFTLRRILMKEADLGAGFQVLEGFFGGVDGGGIYFLESSAEEGVVFNRSPFQPAPELMEKLYAPSCFALFVSATLATSSQKSQRPLLPMMARTGWYCSQGERWREFKRILSPFDYRRQMTVRVASQLPRYDYARDRGRSFFSAVDAVLPTLLRRQGGGCLVLCTAHDHVNRLFKRSQEALEGEGIAVYRQDRGSSPRAVLEQFKDDLNSCLLGTLSLWEGVDVPGDSLRSLVIVKLPYDHPEDPVLKARLQDFERYASILPSESREGLRPLNHYYLPLMVTKLRQGVGRLIRSETDRGELVFLDRRLMESKGRPTLTFILNSLGLDLKDVEELET